MSESAKEFYATFPQGMEQAKQVVPDTIKGFGALFQAVMKNGALKTKEKELVALGIAVAQRCGPCINLHVQKCLEAGNNREEIMEAASVAVVMQGGPAYTHLPQVLEALQALGK
jgi:AhpD family alkylhydroperoxidase